MCIYSKSSPLDAFVWLAGGDASPANLYLINGGKILMRDLRKSLAEQLVSWWMGFNLRVELMGFARGHNLCPF